MKRIDLPDAVERYLAGESAQQIANSHGVSMQPVVRQLKAAGVMRNGSEAKRIYFGTPAFDEPAIVARYTGGESEKSIAVSIGCSRGAIRGVLIKHGVEIRGRSAAMFQRMASATPEERQSLTSAAHAAVRGVPKSDEQQFKNAISREAKQLGISPAEAEFADMLRRCGVESTPQKAVGRYNVDLALAESAVAVEIFGGHWHGSGRHAGRYRERMDDLLDRGWLPIVVWITGTFPLTEAAVQYVVARHQERCRHKAVGGEEHVIRGDGEGGPVSECYPSCVPTVEGPKPRNHA